MGDTGSTVVEESQTLGDEVEFTEGLTIDRGFLSPYFISDQERSLCEFKNPKVRRGTQHGRYRSLRESSRDRRGASQ